MSKLIGFGRCLTMGLLATLLCAGLLASSQAAGNASPKLDLGTVRVRISTAAKDPMTAYHQVLLATALEAAGVKAGIEPCVFAGDVTISDQRAVREVISGINCDLMLAGSGADFTHELTLVPFPVFLGLGGYKVLLVRAGRGAVAEGITDLEGLRRLSFGSGTSWHDTKILQDNGASVEKAEYNRLFPMLRAGRFDAMLRSVFEVYGELKGVAAEGIELEPRLLLHQNSEVFFYVTPGNKALRDALLLGFRRMYCSGRMLTLVYTHPVTRGIWTHVNFGDRRVIELAGGEPATTPEGAAMALYGRSLFNGQKPPAAACAGVTP